MTFPYAVGHPDYSSTGSSKFIPQLWAGKIIVKYYDNTVLSKITNTDYEGEIKKQGDSVIIRGTVTITSEDHHIGDLVTYQKPEVPALTMLIDKGRRWGIALDDIVAVQSDLPLLNKFTDAASMDAKIAIETAFFADSTIYAGMHASNTGLTAGVKSSSYVMGTTGSPVQLTSANILDYIVDCGSVLDEQNVPETGRWLVLPVWAIGMIKKSDIKDASLTNDSTSPLRNGRIGMVDRFTIYNSNLLNHSTTTYYHALFGTNDAISFATQILKTQHLPTPSEAFEERVRGLQVYGYKVVKPEAYGALICYK